MGVTQYTNEDVGNPAIEAITMRSKAVTDTLFTPPTPPQTDLRAMSQADWEKLQTTDPASLERFVMPFATALLPTTVIW